MLFCVMSVPSQELEERCISAIESKNLEKLKQYLSCGLTVNSLLRSRHKIWDTNCLSMLAIASYSGAINIIEFLLQRNVAVNQADILKNRMALHWAVASGNYTAVKLLIEAGASVNAPDRDYISPLILCANEGNLQILRCLLDNKANINQTDRMNSSALHYACMRSHVHIANELIVRGCTNNTSTSFSFCSPLKYLVYNKHYQVAKCLIEAGGDISNEKWLVDGSFKVNDDNDLQFIQWFQAYIQTPRSLMSLCRQRIRLLLASNGHDTDLHAKIAVLAIPKTLTTYLMMKSN